MTMFQQHNNLTITSYWLLALSSVSGLVFLTVYIPQLLREQPWPLYALGAALALMLLLNTYLAYLVYMRSFKALQICMWIYGLQIVGLRTENWTFSLAFTVNPTMSILEIGSAVVVVNLAAAAVFLVLLFAYRSFKDGLKTIASPK